MLRILSIHSSALYAPFPFANGRTLDFLASDTGNGTGTETYRVGRLDLEVRMQFAPPGDGYAVLEVPAGAQPGQPLGLRYIKSGGGDADTIVLHPS